MPNEYNIENGLDDLLGILSKRGNVIIPIARRGIRLLELSSHSQQLFENGMVLFYDSVKFHATELLEKKRLILFDESVNAGDTLRRYRKNLIQLSEDNNLNFRNKIYTAALFVNQDAKQYPDYYLRDLIVSSDIYDRLSEELHYKILSTGRPMDVDHLIGKIEFSESLVGDFIRVLHDCYNAKETGHSKKYENVIMLTIDFNLPNTQTLFPFNIPKIEGFPKLFDDGPRKLRIYIKKNIAHIVPIVYPAMEIKENMSKLREQCPLLDVLDNRALCKVLTRNGVKDQTLQSIICYNCITNELSTTLLSKFLVNLKQQIDFKFRGLDDKSIQVVSHSESMEIVKVLEEKIKRSIDDEEYVPAIIGENAEKCEFRGVSFNEEVSTIKGDYIALELMEDDERRKIKLRPEIEISTALNANKEVNGPLFTQGEYSGLDLRPDGLSYNQIREMMKNMDDLRFSEGMDVALDVGYLKPVIYFKGMKAFSGEKSHQVITRIYTTASEDVSESLNCFLGLITPHR